ncbi:tryptophan synthase beta subunit-like PLP-dependent enzyme [Phyllosticta citrichinensis]|uniref:Tryptophan synthase beta subunit-like PLP-dependent enzyme n=1 Tax=Phyllosticta citrichinensis TaxID=1130410 RepID=A0ABR1XQ16_9PEZI
MHSNIFLNPSSSVSDIISTSPPPSADCVSDSAAAIQAFHTQLPDYNVTPLVPVPSLAAELRLAHVLLKDESSRFGLPAFKILGASWAVHRAVAARMGFPPTVSPADLRDKNINNNNNNIFRLVTCTDGNWGRAVARMARLLALPARIFVPNTMDAPTRHKIASEGADVRVVPGDYDASIAAAKHDADDDTAPVAPLLVMDTSWDGFEEIPSWVVDGYSTMLNETDRQLAALGHSRIPACVIASVGVGSWAQAVTAHYKSKPRRADDDDDDDDEQEQQPDAAAPQQTTRVVAVEPTTAACLQTSLRADRIVPIATGNTIMCGMNWGTVSSLAWPVLRAGIDASVLVSDRESHAATADLHALGVACGPCGAAPLAALRRLCRDGKAAAALGLGPDAVVVLFSTEGQRPYEVPEPDVDDA